MLVVHGARVAVALFPGVARFRHSFGSGRWCGWHASGRRCRISISVARNRVRSAAGCGICRAVRVMCRMVLYSQLWKPRIVSWIPSSSGRTTAAAAQPPPPPPADIGVGARYRMEFTQGPAAISECVRLERPGFGSMLAGRRSSARISAARWCLRMTAAICCFGCRSGPVGRCGWRCRWCAAGCSGNWRVTSSRSRRGWRARRKHPPARTGVQTRER